MGCSDGIVFGARVGLKGRHDGYEKVVEEYTKQIPELPLKTDPAILVTKLGIATRVNELRLNALSPRVTSDVGSVMLVSKLDWKAAHPIKASMGELPKVTDVI